MKAKLKIDLNFIKSTLDFNIIYTLVFENESIVIPNILLKNYIPEKFPLFPGDIIALDYDFTEYDLMYLKLLQ